MTSESTGKLYSKLAEVTSELGYVAKDGKNDFQNYRYTSAEALLAAIRGPLSAKGVVLMPSLTAISEREYTTSKGKASIITTAHVKFTLVDGESGQRHECEWAGQGDDPADKGLGKAFTNAIKTFLREQFLIPQGDDPEADQKTDERASDRAPAAAKPTEPEVAPQKDRDRIVRAAVKKNLDDSIFANVIRLSAGSEPILFEKEADAKAWLEKALPRLPAGLVPKVLENIDQEAPVPA